MILIAVNLKYDWLYLRTVLLALILGGIRIGIIISLQLLLSSAGQWDQGRLKIISSPWLDCWVEIGIFSYQEEIRRQSKGCSCTSSVFLDKQRKTFNFKYKFPERKQKVKTGDHHMAFMKAAHGMQQKTFVSKRKYLRSTTHIK